MINDVPEDQPHEREEARDDDDFARLLATLMRRRWWIAGAIAIGLLAAGSALLVITPLYRSTAVAFPANNKESLGGLSSVLSQFSGVASMAGLDVGDSGNAEALAILTSRQFNERFILANGLMPILFRKYWDASRNDWKPNLRRPITLWDGYDYFFRKVRSVSEDRKTGLLTVHVDWRDRDQAAQWANLIIAQLNQEMRQHAIDEATDMVAYLHKELDKTDNLALKESISKLIESEIKERALATVRYQYAYHVVDSAEPADPRHPIKPQPRVYLVFGAIAGLILGIAAALLDQSINGRRSPPRKSV
jgi:capsular polysaccharide biosynthesis protein